MKKVTLISIYDLNNYAIYRNIITVLRFFDFLTFGDLASLILDKKAIRGYMNEETMIKHIKKLLKKINHKPEKYNNINNIFGLEKLTEDQRINNVSGLTNCLEKLEREDIIVKNKKNNENIYYLTNQNKYLNDILDYKFDLNKYFKEIKNGKNKTCFMSNNIHIFSNYKEINTSIKEEYNEEFLKIVNSIKKDLKKLNKLRKKVGEEVYKYGLSKNIGLAGAMHLDADTSMIVCMRTN